MQLIRLFFIVQSFIVVCLFEQHFKLVLGIFEDLTFVIKYLALI